MFTYRCCLLLTLEHIRRHTHCDIKKNDWVDYHKPIYNDGNFLRAQCPFIDNNSLNIKIRILIDKKALYVIIQRNNWIKHVYIDQFTMNELSLWSLYMCARLGLAIALLTALLKNALMCSKQYKLLNHDCQPIFMFMYIMLYIMHTYFMLFPALSNAVCRMLTFAIALCKCILTSSFFLVYWHMFI